MKTKHKILAALVIVGLASVLVGCSRQPNYGVFHRSYLSSYPYQAELATSMKTALKLESNQAKVQVKMNKGILGVSSTLANAKLEKKDTSISFKNEAMEIEYTLLPNGIQEEIILKTKTETNEFSSTLDLQGLQFVEENNTVRFYNNNNEYLFEFAAPYAVDANNVRTDNVTYELIKDNTKENIYTLTKTVDPEWLFSKDRAYPITVDPTIITIASGKTPTQSENFLHDNIITNDTTPIVKFGSDDPESDDLRYEINWDTDSDFAGANSADSSTDPGFANEDTPADTSPFTSNETITYTFQSALSNTTTYYWRVRARDPGGDDTWSSWSNTRSFTVNNSTLTTTWFQTDDDQFSTNYSTSLVNINSGSNNVTADSAVSSKYYQEVTVTNGGAADTDKAVLVEIDTATLISEVKLSSDCSDLRVGADIEGQTTYDFWIEQGCNTSETQVWVEVPSVPTGDSSFYMIYGDVTGVTDSEAGWAGNFILASDAACPGGWTTDSSLDETFVRGNSSFGGTGGSTTHTHTMSGLTSYGGFNGTTLNFGAVSTGSHNHTYSGSTNATNHAPPYLDFVYCTQSSPIERIDTQFFVYFDASAPAGWTHLTGQDDRFARGNTSYGGTGGSATHTHSYSFNTNTGGTWSGSSEAGGGSILSPAHVHTISGTTAAAGSIPPYYGLLFANPDSNDATFENDAIVAFDTAPPYGWTRFSDLDSKFLNIKSNGTQSTGNGNTSNHSHTFSGSTSFNNSVYTTAHSNNPTQHGTLDPDFHNYSGTSSTASPLPPYKDLLFYERDDDEVLTTLGSEQVVQAVMESTAITADYLGATEGQWDEISFTDTETNGDIKYYVYYDNSGVKTILPDGVLAGNSTGFDTSPIDISGVDADTYSTLYVQAILTYSGGSPNLDDWRVTVNNAPNQVTLSSPSDAANNTSVQPILQFSTTDLNTNNLRYYVQICTDEPMTTNCQVFDQTSSQTGWSGQNGDTSTSYTSGTTATFQVPTPLTAGTNYFWRARAIDHNGSGIWGEYSTVFDFTTGSPPNTPTLDTPTDGATNIALAPTFQTTATDSNADNVQYKITVCLLSEMIDCQVFDQTSSQTGWSDQNADSNTTYTSGTQATYEAQTTLLPNTTYYWKSEAIDPDGSNSFGTTQSTPYSFTTADAPTEPGSCTIQETTDDSSLTLNWSDDANDEEGFNIERSVNGGGFSSLTNPAADSSSYQDTTVSQGNTYQYRVRSHKTVSAQIINSNWCTTSTVTLESGIFSFEGLQLEGIRLD